MFVVILCVCACMSKITPMYDNVNNVKTDELGLKDERFIFGMVFCYGRRSTYEHPQDKWVHNICPIRQWNTLRKLWRSQTWIDLILFLRWKWKNILRSRTKIHVALGFQTQRFTSNVINRLL